MILMSYRQKYIDIFIIMAKNEFNPSKWSYLAVGIGITLFGAYLARKRWAKRNSGMYQEFIVLKKQLQNNKEPTLQLAKKVFKVTFQYSMQKAVDKNSEVRKLRKKYRVDGKITDMEGYLYLLINGLQLSRLMANAAKLQVFDILKIDGKIFESYPHQLDSYKSQLRSQCLEGIKGIKRLTLNELKSVIQRQIGYLQNHSDELVDSIIDATKNWDKYSKQSIKRIISLVIIDQAVTDYIDVDEVDIQSSKKQFEPEISELMAKLKEKELSLMENLNEYI